MLYIHEIVPSTHVEAHVHTDTQGCTSSPCTGRRSICYLAMLEIGLRLLTGCRVLSDNGQKQFLADKNLESQHSNPCR